MSDFKDGRKGQTVCGLRGSSSFEVDLWRLVVRITKNHPLPDGNKRLARQSLTMFCALNGYMLEVASDDAVDLMLAIAAGELDGTEAAPWLTERLHPLTSA